jgi:hypothetical protein
VLTFVPFLHFSLPSYYVSVLADDMLYDAAVEFAALFSVASWRLEVDFLVRTPPPFQQRKKVSRKDPSHLFIRPSTMKVLSALIASLSVLSTAAFAPVHPTQRASSSALSFSAQKDETVRQILSSTLAAAFLAVNLATALPVSAMMSNNIEPDFGSTEVLAGRSGGRSGGRASSGGNSRSYRAPARSSNTYKSYSSTTVVRPSPTVIVSPGYGGGFGYNPLGNMVTGYAMGSMLGGGGNNYNDERRDMRQENEIQQSRMELEQARLKVGYGMLLVALGCVGLEACWKLCGSVIPLALCVRVERVSRLWAWRGASQARRAPQR